MISELRAGVDSLYNVVTDKVLKPTDKTKDIEDNCKTKVINNVSSKINKNKILNNALLDINKSFDSKLNVVMDDIGVGKLNNTVNGFFDRATRKLDNINRSIDNQYLNINTDSIINTAIKSGNDMFNSKSTSNNQPKVSYTNVGNVDDMYSCQFGADSLMKALDKKAGMVGSIKFNDKEMYTLEKSLKDVYKVIYGSISSSNSELAYSLSIDPGNDKIDLYINKAISMLSNMNNDSTMKLNAVCAVGKSSDNRDLLLKYALIAVLSSNKFLIPNGVTALYDVLNKAKLFTSKVLMDSLVHAIKHLNIKGEVVSLLLSGLVKTGIFSKVNLYSIQSALGNILGKFDMFKNKLTNMASGLVGKAMSTVGNLAGKAVGMVNGLANKAMGAVGNMLGNAANICGGALNGVLGGLAGGLAGKAMGMINGLAGKAIGAVGGLANKAMGMLGSAGAGLAGKAMGALSSVGGGLASKAMGALSSIGGSLGNAGAGLAGKAMGMLSSVGGGLAGKAMGMLGSAGGGIGGLLSSIPGLGGGGLPIPSLDFKLPNVTLPSLNIPSLNLPSISMPSINIPNLSLPGMSNSSMSNCGIPTLDLPDLSWLSTCNNNDLPNKKMNPLDIVNGFINTINTVKPKDGDNGMLNGSNLIATAIHTPGIGEIAAKALRSINHETNKLLNKVDNLPQKHIDTLDIIASTITHTKHQITKSIDAGTLSKIKKVSDFNKDMDKKILNLAKSVTLKKHRDITNTPRPYNNNISYTNLNNNSNDSIVNAINDYKKYRNGKNKHKAVNNVNYRPTRNNKRKTVVKNILNGAAQLDFHF